MQRRPVKAARIAALLVGAAIGVHAATPVRLSGVISGTVKNASGVAQMGATVILYNRYDRAVQQALTTADGGFAFNSLIPDLYSIRVSLASFIPAFKRNIAVQPGFHSVLTINMASMLSSIEFVSSAPLKGSLMSDEWKWVLRSSQATRPVLRFQDLERTARTQRPSSIFSETRGVVKVSAGDATSFAGIGVQPDLGTAFALATSLFGTNQLEVSGNFGVSSQTGLPTAGFRTKFKRESASAKTPEMTVSMHQIYVPARGGFGPRPGQDGAPAIRSMTASVIDEITVFNNLRIEYGMSAETISMSNRLNLLSPFARLTYDMGTLGSVRFAYSSGAAATELASRLSETSKEDGSLNRNLAALAMVPRLSMRDGQLRAQRSENLEVGYTKIGKSRTYSAGAYSDKVTNGALLVGGSDSLYEGDMLPDLGSRSSIFNIGSFNRWGYQASVSQSFGDRLEIALGYGRGGTLSADNRELRTNSSDELRGLVRVRNRNWASARLSGTIPLAGTRISTSYGWADYRSLMPSHLFLAQRSTQDPGLNITVRQPLPSFGGVPGRFEATAELRNLLEQGYLPISASDGRVMLLTNSPKAVRGGLSFIF